MKQAMRIELDSRQTDDEGVQSRSVLAAHGTWYDQGTHQFLVFNTDGVSTTLRMDAREWRLLRRGDGMDSWQTFRMGQVLESELALEGSVLPLRTQTWHLSKDVGAEGGALHLEYSLYSGDVHMGDFELTLILTPEPEGELEPK